MPERSRKRSRDLNEMAKSIADEATSEVKPEPEDARDPAAVELGRRGGLKGGRARARKLSAKRRKEIAQKAAEARWKRP
ncbi:MAG: histone H1 [Actinomycetota bacterium]